MDPNFRNPILEVSFRFHLTSRADQECDRSRYVRGYLLAFADIVFDVCAATLVKLHCKPLNTVEVNFVRFGGAGVTLGLPTALL